MGCAQMEIEVLRTDVTADVEFTQGSIDIDILTTPVTADIEVVNNAEMLRWILSMRKAASTSPSSATLTSAVRLSTISLTRTTSLYLLSMAINYSYELKIKLN